MSILPTEEEELDLSFGFIDVFELILRHVVGDLMFI